MPVDFYYFLPSPFCRSVLLAAKAIGLELNLKEVKVWEGEQQKPEFLAINPHHTVPTLVDGDLTIWESRAILTYLVSEYGKDDSLYPKDTKVRAKIDSLLYFDMGTLVPAMKDVMASYTSGQKDVFEEKLKKMKEVLGWLENFLARGRFAAGTNHLTVADHALVASISTFKEIPAFPDKYPGINAWLERCKAEMPGYEELNDKGVKMVAARVQKKLSGQ